MKCTSDTAESAVEDRRARKTAENDVWWATEDEAYSICRSKFR